MQESAVENILSQVNTLSADERKALLAALTRTGTEHPVERRSALGKYAGLLTPVDEFLRVKHDETEREDEGSRR